MAIIKFLFSPIVFGLAFLAPLIAQIAYSSGLYRVTHRQHLHRTLCWWHFRIGCTYSWQLALG